MAIGAFHVHHFEFVNILQSKLIVIFLLESRSEHQPFLKTASLISNQIKNNLYTKNKSMEMKLRSAVQCCVLAGTPREVRQPRKLTCIDFTKQNAAATVVVRRDVAPCLPKTYHGGPDQYQVVQVHLAFLPPFACARSTNAAYFRPCTRCRAISRYTKVAHMD